uniref:Sushi domain-containing protein n=1 Tax=Magallana gigas TaxID=29159 RepID=A0A8W8NWX0_MAGGI
MAESVCMRNVREWDAIGINRRIHITCAEGFEQQGSGKFVCRPDGVRKSDLTCSFKPTFLGCFKATLPES